ncbi:uncharacterized protein LOC144716383 [Wolffia australiana]
MLNVEQQQMYDAIFKAIDSAERAKEAKVFFVDGPGGSGKTFLYSAILAQIRASRHNAILTCDKWYCNASYGRSCKHYNVDEAPIMHCRIYEMLDRSIRDVMNSIEASLESVPFGNKVNNTELDVFLGEVTEYYNFDAIPPSVVDNESLYPIEFLNTIDDATMPLHKLRLEIVCIVILLQNLNTLQGLCNETRLRVDVFFPTML